uniref:ATP synthase subunit a n=1 Tax=Conomurex luhuanus TaxID=69696 RepID=A0A222AKA4_CONLU|nr:ATP synthase F0 subunit 6 [Conomurex luhuanus]ASO76831.1 ATP synthase F0 subunit 6 [Conomurex luhuanus]
MSLYGLMWLFSLVTILVFSSSYWVMAPRWVSITMTFKDTVSSQIFRSFGLNLGGFINVVSGLFLFLIVMNLSGLIPYVFSPTSHLAISLSLGLPLWLSLIISAVFFNPSSVVAGLLPMGAPAPLNPFLVIIETVSIMVRPITLSVRLTANMSAGHIVLTLIGNYLTASFFMSSMFSMLLLISIQVFYTIFEFGISVIQAYIFCLLITLYSDEHPH